MCMCVYSKEGNNQLYLLDQGRFANVDSGVGSEKISRNGQATS